MITLASLWGLDCRGWEWKQDGQWEASVKDLMGTGWGQLRRTWSGRNIQEVEWVGLGDWWEEEGVLVCQGYRKNFYRPGGLNNRNLFSHSSGDYKPTAKVSGGLVSPKASLLSLLCRHGAFLFPPAQAHPWCSSAWPTLLSLLGWIRPTLRTAFQAYKPL